MDTVPHPDDSGQAARSETEAERQRRLAWEAEMIAEADADIAAGFYVDSDEMDVWIDSIGTDHELPPPRTRRRWPGRHVPRRLIYEISRRNG
jgi:hypothetical protein